MPHIILQQSNNGTNNNSKIFFKNIHQLLADKLPTQLETCTSRLIIADNYWIASGAADLAFAHLEIAIYEGRSSAILTQLSHDLHKILSEHLTLENTALDIHITVEIRILSKFYSKGY